ncbi:MAG: hypothetical protein Q9221_002699 [Calogaya cf. arnoldii]
MRLLASVLCAASLVSAVPSRNAFPDISIQVSFDEHHKDSAIRTFSGLPDKFILATISDKISGAFYGLPFVGQYAPLEVNRKTTFFLSEGKLLVSSPNGDLAVAKSPAGGSPPLVRLMPLDEAHEALTFQSVEKADGMYIEMTPAGECPHFCMVKEIICSWKIRGKHTKLLTEVFK